jgi:predicted nucleotidyltransferase
MRTDAPLLLPIFRSRGQGRLLARIYLHPDEPIPLAGLAREIGLDAATVLREVNRLEQAGLVVSERIGRSRVVRPDERSPFYPELSALIVKAFGPSTVLARRLQGLPEVEAAYIFGSWAGRYHGEPGPAPADIDLLVVGRPDRRVLARVCREAGRELGLEINPTVVTKEGWESDETPFVRSLKQAPLVALDDTHDRG